VIAPETCEDGNTNNFDGCDSSCKVEDGWTAGAHVIFNITTGTQRTTLIATCGDGKKVSAEVCDDNKLDNDATSGCSGVCTAVKAGYICTPGDRLNPSQCFAKCGDTIFISTLEQCED
jgi:cysteine-rich repeat protein